MITMYAAILVTLTVATLAIGAAVHTLKTGFPWSLPASLIASGFLGFLLAIGTYAPDQNPDALNERTLAMQISGMYLQAERSAVGAPGADPYRKGAIAEDDACTRAEDWYGYAQEISLR